MGPSEFSGSFSGVPNLKVCKVSSLGHTSTSHLLKNHYLVFTTFILHCKFDNYAKIDTGSFIKLIDVNLIRAYVSVSEVCK